MSYPKTKLMNLEDGQTLLAAVDGKMSDLKSAFVHGLELCGVTTSWQTWDKGFINGDNGNYQLNSNFRYTTGTIPINGHKRLYIVCPETYNSLFISLYDSSDAFIRNDTITDFTTYSFPLDAVTFRINYAFGRVVENSVMAGTAIYVFDYFDSEYMKSTDGINIIARNIIEDRFTHQYYDLFEWNELEQGKFNASGEKANSTTQFRTAEKLRLPIGTSITVIALGTTADRIVVFLKYDENERFIETENVTAYDTMCTATYITTSPYINIALYTASATAVDVPNMYRILIKKPTLLSGKRMTVFGDSLSTFDGFSDHDTAYYPKTGLTSVSQTYWGMVFNILGLTIDTVNAIGGSRCAGSLDIRISSDTRLANLGTPDIILFAAGTNDIYANSATGQWSGDDLSTLDTATFIPAYTKCIKSMQTNHPNTIIIAISPCFINTNGSSDRQYCTIENVQRICEAEKMVCDYMGVKFIDARKIAMKTTNVSDYTIDGLHWNYQFTKHLANEIIDTIVN